MYTCEKLITRKFLRFLVSRCLRLVTKLASWTSLNSYLEHLETRLASRSLKFSIIEDRVSRDCQLTFERYCMYWAIGFNMKRMELMVSSSFNSDRLFFKPMNNVPLTLQVTWRILLGRVKIRNFSSSVEKYFSTGKEKFHISKRPCNILFII